MLSTRYLHCEGRRSCSPLLGGGTEGEGRSNLTRVKQQETQIRDTNPDFLLQTRSSL